MLLLFTFSPKYFQNFFSFSSDTLFTIQKCLDRPIATDESKTINNVISKLKNVNKLAETIGLMRND